MKRPPQPYAQQVTRALAERDELEREKAALELEVARLRKLAGLRDQTWRDVRALQTGERP